jgi:NADH-quinone oxidoreductase subunit J
MVLFVFVVMMLSMGPHGASEKWEKPGISAWIGPGILFAVLLAELLYVFGRTPYVPVHVAEVTPRQVGARLLGPYLLGVELVSMLLLVGLTGAFHLAYHLGKRETQKGAGGSR